MYDALEIRQLIGCTELQKGLRSLYCLCCSLSCTCKAQVITTPFFPGYLTPERIAKAKKLKLALTAGIGSDHVDLEAASEAGITVAEVTGESP